MAYFSTSFFLVGYFILFKTLGILSASDALCNGNGAIVGGVCQCYEGFFGKECALNETTAMCSNSASTEAVCSGRGVCVGGHCECYARAGNLAQRYTGMYCQCDDYSCSFYNNVLCGGHGQCVCGACVCENGFGGEACECSSSVDTCMAANGKICNGFGDCICGRCQCSAETQYRGPTCEDCPTCPGSCEAHRSCVECRAFHIGPYSDEECEDNCSMLDIIVVGDISQQQGTSWRMCRFMTNDGDTYDFWYMHDDGNKIAIKAKRNLTGAREKPSNGGKLEPQLAIQAKIFSLVGFLLLYYLKYT